MRRVALTIVSILLFLVSNAQPFAVSFEDNQLPVEVLSSLPESQIIRFNYPGIRFFEVNTTNGVFNQMAVPGTYRTGIAGEPQLVSSHKLVAVPLGAEVTVKVHSYQKEEYQVAQLASNIPLIPYQPSVSKSEDSSKQELVISTKAYKKDKYSKQPLASVEVLGTMHGIRLAKLTINPVRYNPVSNSIVFYNHIEIEITYKNADLSATQSQLVNTYSPYFNSQFSDIIPTPSYPNNPDLVKQPVRYLLVTPSAYLNSLHDFIQWKTQKGFEVVIGNTDEIGKTASQIKLWVKAQYADTLEGKPSPSFLVLVGDIEQIPASQIGARTYKATDLYYASVDGDMFPDLYYGRLPAKDTIQLIGMLNKILLYERYQFPDDSFLNDVTLIAGADPTWNPRVAQPTIKYGTENYFNTVQGFSSVNAYLTSYVGCYNINKIGVSFINYTAHCLQTTWGDPYLSSSTVSGFTNSGKFPLVVGNCCQSGDFSINTCMGEAWIRNPNGGAIAYIGSVPDTYWYEDFYWAVGAHAPVANSYPTVAGSSTGMYDAPFTSDYRTADALLFAGNLAVTEAHNQGYIGDVDSKYYWEAYHCLGDPSVIPYFKKGLVQAVGHLAKLESGIGEFTVEALPGSQATLSTKTKMLATALITSEGKVALYFDSNLETDSVKLVVTKPKYIPYISDIPVSVSHSSYLALKSFSFADENGNQNGLLDYNEKAKLKLEIENVGDSISQHIFVGISCSDPYIRSITQSVYKDLSPLSTGGIGSINNFFELRVSDSVPDQHVVWLAIQASDSLPGKSRKVYSYQRQIILNAPDLKILSPLKLDDFEGNGSEWADAGELLSLTVGFVNSGHAQVSATAILESQSENPLFLISDSTIYFDSIQPGDTIFQTFPAQVIVNPQLFADTLQFSVDGAKYQKSRSFIVPVGIESPKKLGTEDTQLIDYPFNNWFKNNRTQILYTKEEIRQGICQITSLGFNFSTITANAAYRDLRNCKIRILATDKSELSGFIDMTAAALVYNQSIYYLPSIVGWQTIPLQQPILMTEASNLVIEISWGTNDDYVPTVAERTKVFGSATTFTSTAFGYHNVTNPPLLNGVTKLRPNIQLIYDTLSILTVDIAGNLPITNGLEIAGCNLSIGTQSLVTDGLGRAKYISNQVNELLQISANTYGYRDTTFSWQKSGLFSHLTLELERNPKLVVEVKNNWGLPIPDAQFTINGYSFITGQHGILDCFVAEKGVFSTYTITKQGFHSYIDSVNPNGLTDTLKVIMNNDLADAKVQVTNTKMKTIAGALVTIDGESFVTDSSGIAIARDLVNGVHTFSINAQGFVGHSGFFIIQNSDTLLSIKLQTVGSVQFIITDGFLPLNQVALVLAGFEQITDSLGKVMFEQIVEGNYNWKASKNGYFESTGCIYSFGAFNQIRIELKPIPDLTFYVYNGFTSLNEVTVSLNDSLHFTDSIGLIKIVDADTGAYSYSAAKEGYEPKYGSFVLGGNDTLITIKLQSIPDLKVAVYDAEGRVEGAKVKVNSDSLFTNSLGEVLFTDLGAGNFSVSISCVGYQPKNLEVTLLKSDTLVSVDLSKIPDISWYISSYSQPVDSATIQFDGKEYLTNIFGNLVLADVENGEYTYQITKPGYVEVDSNIIVNGTDQLVCHIMEKLSDLKLIVFDGSNQPITDVLVSLELGTFTTDTSGIAFLKGIRKGLYHYTLLKEGYLPVIDSIQVNADTVTEIALMLLETYQVQFTVFDAGNNPMNDAQITFNEEIKVTNSSGIAIWNGLLSNHSYDYRIQKIGYFIKTGTVSIVNSNLDEKVVLEFETFDVVFRVTDEKGLVASANISFDNKAKSTGSTGEAVFYNIVPADSSIYIVRKLETHITDTGCISVHSDTLIDVYLLTISVTNQLADELLVFPNPTNGKIILTGNQMYNGTQYQIYNALGTIVAEGTIDAMHQTVDLSEQKQGVYYLYVRFQNTYQAIKIIRE